MVGWKGIVELIDLKLKPINIKDNKLTQIFFLKINII